jgi:lipopolysaccharide/colanic/teichoic acid biosynthesis glycosyltransferase
MLRVVIAFAVIAALIAIGVKLSSPGPVIFKTLRTGPGWDTGAREVYEEAEC